MKHSLWITAITFQGHSAIGMPLKHLVYMYMNYALSEWITHSKVPSYTVLEARYVVVTALAGVIRSMESDSEIETQNEELHVVAQTCTCAQRYLIEHAREGDFALRMTVVLFKIPYVAGIDKECTVKVSGYAETILGIEFETEISRLVEICASPVSIAISARTYGTHGKGTYAVRTSGIELFAVWCNRRVSVGKDCA